MLYAQINLFDCRIKESGWLIRLNQRSTRTHLRSLLLQVLFVMPLVARPSWFLSLYELSRWDQVFLNSGNYQQHLFFNFSFNAPGIDRLVVGVEGKEQLVQLLEIEIEIHSIGLKLDGLAFQNVALIKPYRKKLQ